MSLLGFTFQGKFYFDKCLPMGCSISWPYLRNLAHFWSFAFLIKFPGRHLSLTTWMISSFKSWFGCKQLLVEFSAMCSKLGVPLAIEKNVGPRQSITYLGLEIDSQ